MERQKSWSKRWRLAGRLLLTLVAMQLLADGIYALVVGVAAARWEASVTRDAAGVLLDCQARTYPPQREGRPVGLLLVHGINASPRHYDLIGPALAKEGVECVAMRLPAFCEPLDRYRRSTADQWRAEIGDQLRTLRGRHERVGVVAHSLGAAATLAALRDNPAAADFAVLVTPAIAVSDARSPLMSTRAWHELSQRVLVFSKTLWTPFASDCQACEGEIPGQSPFTPTAVVDELFRLMDENVARFADLQTPLTFILSETDAVVSTPAAREYFSKLPIEQKRLVSLDRCGHEALIDRQWNEVKKEILAEVDKFAAQMATP
ncbi:alpha/beta hydrolase [Botrimarina hoheduenensis]|uniref:Thermostable monoacylglycerol lipase n=1 Tax=Botrimarina hoheduenensis TaxID=2528000 RepID=A0A5C5WB07_9BACT|nr:alpha/beta fold hydrolase [Botrimarina hoheduenensis]TWT47433.1 Thermostable monoacylglycerol lipase [Botrimarina hoheduenensis]